MTKEQIENFRKVLVSMVGPYALIMPDIEIIAFRDKMQENLDKLDKNTESTDLMGGDKFGDLMDKLT